MIYMKDDNKKDRIQVRKDVTILVRNKSRMQEEWKRGTTIEKNKKERK